MELIQVIKLVISIICIIFILIGPTFEVTIQSGQLSHKLTVMESDYENTMFGLLGKCLSYFLKIEKIEI